MPWTVMEGHPDCEGYAVVKEGTTEMVPGGCHLRKSEAMAHMQAMYAAMPEEMMGMRAVMGMRAMMSTKDINDLPDDAFAYIEPGGQKDESGKTVPRSKRHFPIHDAAHVRNALARASQSPFGSKAMPKILAAAKKFGIGETKSLDIPRNLPEVVALRCTEALPWITARQRNTTIESRLRDVELREVTDHHANIHGYSTIYDYQYPVAGGPDYGGWNETVRSGATKKSLQEREDVRLLINHTGLPIARTKPGTMTLRSDGVGLLMDATVDLRSVTVRDLVLAMERGDVDEMSFAFEVTKQKWNRDYTERDILEVKMFDNSIVTYPANGAASAYIKKSNDRSLTPVGEHRGRSLAYARAQLDLLKF